MTVRKGYELGKLVSLLTRKKFPFIVKAKVLQLHVSISSENRSFVISLAPFVGTFLKA